MLGCFCAISAAGLHCGSPCAALETASHASQVARRSAEVRTDVDADDLLRAVANLCLSAQSDGPSHAGRMVALLVDGLRFGTGLSPRS